MAKPNVNTASRGELLGSGLRTPVVDAIIQRRKRKGGINLAMLAEIPGVGPGTIERVRPELDFTPPAATAPKPRRQRAASKPAEPVAEPGTDIADTALQAGTEQAAELVAAATQGHAEVATGAPPVVRPAIEAGGLATVQEMRSGMDLPMPTAATTGQRQSQVLALEVGLSSSFTRMFAEVLREQTEENAEATVALAQAENVTAVLQLQGDYLRHTLDRMANLNRRCLDLAAKTWPESQSD